MRYMRLVNFDIYEWNSQIQKKKKQISGYEKDITNNEKILKKLNADFFGVNKMDLQKKKKDTRRIHKYKEITKELLEDRDKIWELAVSLEYMEKVLEEHKYTKKGFWWAWIWVIFWCWAVFGIITTILKVNNELMLIITLSSPILPFIYDRWEKNKDFSKSTKHAEENMERELSDRDIPRTIKNILKTEDDGSPLENIRSIVWYYDKEVFNLKLSYYIEKYSDLWYKSNNNYHDNDDNDIYYEGYR